jgi:hypothetical protein
MDSHSIEHVQVYEMSTVYYTDFNCHLSLKSHFFIFCKIRTSN